MLFLSVVTSLLAFGAFTAAASPTPSLKRRQDITNVLAIVDGLQSKTDSILPQIDSLINTGEATVTSIEPLAFELVGVLASVGSSLEAIQGQVDPAADGALEEVVQKTAAIFNNVVQTLDNVRTKKPQLYSIFPKHGIEAALLKVLIGLEFVVGGALRLVSVLLGVAERLLSGLGFALIKALLGFH